MRRAMVLGGGLFQFGELSKLELFSPANIEKLAQKGFQRRLTLEGWSDRA